MEKSSQITKEMKISEIVEKYPQILSLLLEKGFHCFGCPLAPDETLEEAAKVHGFDLEKLLEDLNKATQIRK
jgi:hybrid cluster-associated redox disulfide protein